MTHMSITEIRENLAETINQVAYKEERIILQRQGKDVAALVPLSDLKILEKLDDYLDMKDADEAMEEARQKGTIPWEQVKKELGL